MILNIIKALLKFNIRQLRLKFFFCPVCLKKRILIKINSSKGGIRCTWCLAGIATISICEVINKIITKSQINSVYELSSRGPLVKYLLKNFTNIVLSEYFPDKPLGNTVNDIRNENVEKLTFENLTFDLITSTEVFEHVHDDIQGFKEVYRTLNHSGYFIFTVPLNYQINKTIVRSVIKDGKLVHLRDQKFHNDNITGKNSVLVMREYGLDILEKLRNIGFANVIHKRIGINGEYYGFSNSVIIAKK